MATHDAPSIRIALLGADDITPAIVQAIAASRRFDVSGVCELEDLANPALAKAVVAAVGRVRHIDAWEALLDGDLADAVVVARATQEDFRTEQLRKLIQTSVPVLASHPVVGSMLVYYELDMIRRDTGGLVVPLLPERHHPAVRELCSMVARGNDSPLGTVEQVVFQRRMADSEKQRVVGQFARDVDVIRAIAGDMTRLGAMAPAHHSGSYAGLGVQMSGPANIAARWSVEPMGDEAGAQLSVLGSRGKVIVEIRADDQPWSMRTATDGQSEVQTYGNWSPAAAALAQFEEALDGRPTRPDWVDAARAVELAETIHRSLEKSRTVDLYYEDYTEEGTFKGTMASLGCGLLVLGLFVMGAVAIGDHLHVPYIRAWPKVLAGGLGVFLLLQLLMLVFRRDDARRAGEASAHDVERPSG